MGPVSLILFMRVRVTAWYVGKMVGSLRDFLVTSIDVIGPWFDNYGDWSTVGTRSLSLCAIVCVRVTALHLLSR